MKQKLNFIIELLNMINMNKKENFYNKNNNLKFYERIKKKKQNKIKFKIRYIIII